MVMFEIRQKIPNYDIYDDYADIDDIHIGFIEDEFVAQEFCNAHPDCTYGQVVPTKYLNQLRGQLVESKDDLTIIKIPVKKWEDFE